jgi:hypothetical protein
LARRADLVVSSLKVRSNSLAAVSEEAHLDEVATRTSGILLLGTLFIDTPQAAGGGLLSADPWAPRMSACGAQADANQFSSRGLLVPKADIPRG